MSIRVFRRDNRVELWVTNDVPQTEIERYMDVCRLRGLPLVVYRSGRGDLVDLTADLLAANRGLAPQPVPVRDAEPEL